jgi:hypothetical protein
MYSTELYWSFPNGTVLFTRQELTGPLKNIQKLFHARITQKYRSVTFAVYRQRELKRIISFPFVHLKCFCVFSICSNSGSNVKGGFSSNIALFCLCENVSYFYIIIQVSGGEIYRYDWAVLQHNDARRNSPQKFSTHIIIPGCYKPIKNCDMKHITSILVQAKF